MPIQKYVKSAGKEKNRMGHKITLARPLVPYLKNNKGAHTSWAFGPTLPRALRG